MSKEVSTYRINASSNSTMPTDEVRRAGANASRKRLNDGLEEEKNKQNGRRKHKVPPKTNLTPADLENKTNSNIKKQKKLSHESLLLSSSSSSCLQCETGSSLSSQKLSAAVAPPATPQRDCSNLYAPFITYQCSIQNKCVSCAYKIGCFDVALDKEFCGEVPNVRPELCPRSEVGGSRGCRTEMMGANLGGGQSGGWDSNNNNENTNIMGYRRDMHVLTIGDGDFTFSLAIARIVLTRTNNGGRGGRVVATSYESHDTLLQVYPNIESTISELQSLGALICYEVDGTRLDETLPSSVLYQDDEDRSKTTTNTRKKEGRRKQRKFQQYHRIVWNFPCLVVPSGRDGQNNVMEQNKHLIRRFVSNAAQVLQASEGGEIHICHKTKPPFDQWNIQKVALEGISTLHYQPDVEQQQQLSPCNNNDNYTEGRNKEQPSERLMYLGRIVFDRCIVPPYIPRKALDRKSFTCHDACVYVFGFRKPQSQDERSDKNDGNSTWFPPTIPVGPAQKEKVQDMVTAINDGRRKSNHDQITICVPVNTSMISHIRKVQLLQAETKKQIREHDVSLKKNQQTSWRKKRRMLAR